MSGIGPGEQRARRSTRGVARSVVRRSGFWLWRLASGLWLLASGFWPVA